MHVEVHDILEKFKLLMRLEKDIIWNRFEEFLSFYGIEQKVFEDRPVWGARYQMLINS